MERGFTGLAYADVNNIKSDYNFSNIDEPQQFRGTVNYTLPMGFEVDSTMKFTAGSGLGSTQCSSGKNAVSP